MHTYTVEFRVYGRKIQPSAITQELGLEPSTLREAGSRQSDKSTWEEAIWGFNGGKSGHWECLEDGINFVLDKLEPVKDKLAGFNSFGKQVWWCGHFQSSFDGGPSFSPTLLNRLANFGTELYIDNYYSKES